MTAASGVVHEEKHSRVLDRQIPSVSLPDGAGAVRVIAGEFEGVKGPAETFTPINLWELRLNTYHRAEFMLPRGFTTALFVLRGEVALADAERAGESDLALLTREGELLHIEAREEATLLVLNGAAIDEPVAAYGPFVMNSKTEITQAIEDYHDGRLGRLAA